MKLKPRNRWFANTDKDACEDWYGPHKTIEDAVNECADLTLVDADAPIYVAQGRKMTKAELDEFDTEFTWEVDTREVLEIKYLLRETTYA